MQKPTKSLLSTRAFAFIFLIFSLSACGKFARLESNGRTALTITGTSQGMGPLAVLTGRIMIYVIGQGGTDFVKAFSLENEDYAASRTISVPNGVYKVYAIGWDHASNPVEGNNYCGFGNGGSNIVLNGTSQTVNLLLTKPNCDASTSTIFSPGDILALNTDPLANLYVGLCTDAAMSVTCTTYTTTNHDIAMKLKAFEGPKNNPTTFDNDGLDYGCATHSASLALTSKVVPVGNPAFADSFFYSVFQVWSSTGGTCSGTMQKEFVFKRGIQLHAQYPASTEVFFDYTSSVSNPLHLKYP